MDHDSTSETSHPETTSSDSDAGSASASELLDELSVSDPDTGVRLIRRLKTLVGRYLEVEQRAKALGIDSVEGLADEVATLQDRVDRLQEERDAVAAALSDGSGKAEDDAEADESGLRHVFNQFYEEMRELHDVLGVDTNREAIETVRKLFADDPSEPEEPSHDSASEVATAVADAAGTADPKRIAQLLRDLQAQLLAAHLGDAAVNADLDGASPDDLSDDFVADDTLVDRLESMSSDALNDLDVGAIAVNDAGEVLYANDAATFIPGLRPGLSDDATPSFFDEVAPTSDHPFFRGRFERGVETGEMDVSFRYVLLPPGSTAPLSMAVRLHSKPSESIHWILVRPL